MPWAFHCWTPLPEAGKTNPACVHKATLKLWCLLDISTYKDGTLHIAQIDMSGNAGSLSEN
jgi:hypothetical protein